MKKHLIAAAVVAALSAPAMAQNAVISGVIDYAYAAKSDSTAATTTTVAPTTGHGNAFGTSRIDLTMTEDLGGGLKATAFLSQAIDASSALSGRDQFVGIEGGFGNIRIGRLDQGFNAGYGAYAVTISTNGVGSSDSTNHDLMAGTLGQSSVGGSFARQNGVIQYISPAFMGATVSVETARNKSEAASANANTKVQMDNLRLDYKNGPLTVGLGSGKRKVDSSSSDNIQDEVKANYVGIGYDLGVAQVKFAQGNRKDSNDGATAGDITVNNFGIVVPMGAASFRASFYDGKDKVTTSATDDHEVRGYQVGVIYSLSKRTSVYGYIGKNETKLATGGTTGLEKAEATYIGLSHTF